MVTVHANDVTEEQITLADGEEVLRCKITDGSVRRGKLVDMHIDADDSVSVVLEIGEVRADGSIEWFAETDGGDLSGTEIRDAFETSAGWLRLVADGGIDTTMKIKISEGR